MGDVVVGDKKRLAGIQTLRAIAFLEIFLGHCGVQWCAASFGVSIFMILSGFCMAINYLPKADKFDLSPVSSVKFAFDKIKKLYPLHLIMAAAIYVIVQMPTSGKAIPRLIKEILLVKCWTTHSEDYFAYNGVAWYLSTYLFICMMAPYALKLISKIKNKVQLLISGACIYVFMLGLGYYLSLAQIPIGDTFAKWATYINPFYRILDFSLGAMLGWLFLRRQEEDTKNRKMVHLLEFAALAAFILQEYAYLPVKENYMGIGYNVYFTLSSLLIVWVFAVSGGIVTKLLNNKVFLWIGNLSGYMFLIHQVVIRGLKMYTGKSLSGTIHLLYIITGTFVISVAGAYIYIYLGKVVKKMKAKA